MGPVFIYFHFHFFVLKYRLFKSAHRSRLFFEHIHRNTTMIYTLMKLLCLSTGLYRSYKAVKSGKKTLLIQWVAFWIVMVAYRFAEFMCDSIVGWWLPLYSYGKLMIVGYLLFTQPWGAETLYKQYIRPNIKYHQKDIESIKDNYTMYLAHFFKGLARLAVYMAGFILTIMLQLKDLISRKVASLTIWQSYNYRNKESSLPNLDSRYPKFQTTSIQSTNKSHQTRVSKRLVKTGDSSS
ncbi:Receptor expression-enhancing protein 2 [Basidiobolus ranarum]|uniref:Protein YOP1 n=1 Tax=Basidiobolus ranarum TaxID=34480 RepID=A0ABR2WM80_9FUNG